MNKRVGFFGLMVAAAVALFAPAVASAQNRYDCRPGYVTRDYRVREWRPEYPVRVVRERPRVFVERGYAPAYQHNFRRPEPRPGLSWYGR